MHSSLYKKNAKAYIAYTHAQHKRPANNDVAIKKKYCINKEINFCLFFYTIEKNKEKLKLT